MKMMGWLQFRKFLSFLPAAFFVYILLHYLIYQPILPDLQSSSFLTVKSFQSRKDLANISVSNTSISKSIKPLNEEETLLTLPKGGLLSSDQDNDESQAKPESPTDLKNSVKIINKETKLSVTATEPPQSHEVKEKRELQKGTSPSSKSIAEVTPPKSIPSKPVVPVRAKKTTERSAKDNEASKFALNSLKGKIVVGEKYEKGFTTPHEELCPNNGRDLRVLILITTAPDHEKHRNAVRQTWGHFALRKDVSLGFMVGRTLRGDVQTVIDKENERYGDIIEANFIDHYSNLTLKTVSMLEWTKTYCSEARFILKTDDDMFINVPLLLAFIHTKQNERNAMFGRLAKGWKPVRNRKSKYYVDVNTFWRVRYPDFVTGPAYLFTNDVVEKLYNKVLSSVFFVLEDVLLTGFVAESLKINRIGDSHFRNEKVKLTDTCKLMQTISIHMVKYEEQFDIYKRTLDGKTKCRRR